MHSPSSSHARRGKAVMRRPQRLPSKTMLEVARMASERNPVMLESLPSHLAYFWHHQMGQMNDVIALQHHVFPMTRVKRAMKADDEIKMISADAPHLLSKAIELFVLELTVRTWCHTVGNNRQTIARSDVASAVALTEPYNFLGEKVPWEKVKREMLGEVIRYDWLHI